MIGTGDWFDILGLAFGFFLDLLFLAAVVGLVWLVVWSRKRTKRGVK